KLPILAACSAVSVICPSKAAVVHSLLMPMACANCGQLRFLRSLCVMISSVTSLRVMTNSFNESSNRRRFGPDKRAFGCCSYMRGVKRQAGECQAADQVAQHGRNLVPDEVV